MKKRNLWLSLADIALGLCFLAAGIVWSDSRASSLLCGFGGGLLGSGILQLRRYLKWSRPENAEAYREKLEQEQIDLGDERKQMLRDKAGRYAYILSLAVGLLATFVVSLLGIFDVWEGYLPTLCLLMAYVVFQYAAGVWFYKRLSQKY